MVEFKGAHFEKDIILTYVRWYVAYPLNYRQLEERMQEQGVAVNHATINRWVLCARRRQAGSVSMQCSSICISVM